LNDPGFAGVRDEVLVVAIALVSAAYRVTTASWERAGA
jgi:hypothetical protein